MRGNILLNFSLGNGGETENYDAWRNNMIIEFIIEVLIKGIGLTILFWGWIYIHHLYNLFTGKYKEDERINRLRYPEFYD